MSCEENMKYPSSYLWGSQKSSYTTREFNTAAEAIAYDDGVEDANGWLECRRLEDDEVDFLENCDPHCSNCDTIDPQEFEAFETWRTPNVDVRAEQLILDKCNVCRSLEEFTLEKQKWHFSKEQGCNVRAVFTAVASQYDMIDGEPNYIPCLAIEGESGYIPARGGEDGSPWYWGKTYDECQKVCDQYNQEHYGISKREAAIIVAGTMNHD